jgi:hypothetical protein
MKQAELVNRFLEGDDSGEASNLEIRRLDEDRIGLVGYENMLYAEYDETEDEIIIYTDWQKTVPKVEKHIQTVAAQAGSVETGHRTVGGTPLVEV